MLYSKIFSKTSKTAPSAGSGQDQSDANSVNTRLLTQAGFISKQMAGVYTFLPLGLRVINKIQNIIKSEMENLGASEISMPALTQEDIWEKTNRAKNEELFHLQGQGGARLVLNPTHEEVITPLAKGIIASYRDLPLAAYQFQVKFRNELRAKSGLLRCREFLMKDLYSFHSDLKDLNIYYEKVRKAYEKIFQQLTLGEKVIFTFASGGTFSQYSHEFQALCDAGEDTIHLCEKCRVAVNEEIIKEQKVCPQCGNQKLTMQKAVEVGNIFKLRIKFSRLFALNYKDANSHEYLVEMGCYGIGLSRTMGVLVEIFHDDKGIIWPEKVAPFQAQLLGIENSKRVKEKTEKIYQQLTKQGIEVLYDDREDVSAGEKFADADLIGIPWRLVVSEKTLAKKSVEIKQRNQQKASLKTLPQVIKAVTMKH